MVLFMGYPTPGSTGGISPSEIEGSSGLGYSGGPVRGMGSAGPMGLAAIPGETPEQRERRLERRFATGGRKMSLILLISLYCIPLFAQNYLHAEITFEPPYDVSSLDISLH
jgi:hypothetical protein